VSFDDATTEALLEAMATARSIRRYRPEPLPTSDLARIMFAATRAPSGSNRQPFRFLVLRDGPVAREARVMLGESFRAGWRSKRAIDHYGDGTGRADDSPKARMARAMQYYVDHLEEAPVIVLACLNRYRPPHPLEGASVYPACQNLLLAARVLGYGGVLTAWHQPVEDRLRVLLGIPETTSIAATITLGRPQGHHGPVRRRPVDELVYDDTWGARASWAVEPEGTRHAGPRPETA
jgi:nitroreductase